MIFLYFCTVNLVIHTMLNKKIYDYTLKSFLGEGGMAEVWYAENSLGKAAAIKILKETFVGNKEVADRFRNEALLMANLKNPNIRRVYDYGTIDERPCIIMAYLQGKDLSKRMEKGERFDSKLMQQWWNQLVDTLEYTHREKVVHRDIKPSNLFLTDKGEIKLLDFGIAKIKDSIVISKTGMRIGTPMYMSPEQVNNSKNVDYRSDIYSLTVTFYHLLKGSAPYDHRLSDFEMQIKIVQEPLILKDIPPEWISMLTPYLAKDPDKRPALKRFELKRNEPDNHVAPNTDPADRKKKSGKNMIYAALAGIITALVFCVFYFDMLKSPEQGAYEEALHTGTPESCEAYLQKYPNSVHYSEINSLYEHLIYNKGDSLYLIKEYAEAAMWLHKSAERDNTAALITLGFMYRNGWGVQQNESIAFELYEKSAHLGDPEGQNSLGYMYRLNTVTPKNDSIAVIWFRKSAEQDHAPGQSNLGFMYKAGYGVPKDCNEAIKWLTKAAEKNNRDAKYLLGDLYENGCDEVPANLIEALKWFNEASKQGHQAATERLGKIQVSKN